MDIQQRGMLTLIRCGLTGEKMPLPEGFDLEAAYPELLRHQVLALGYLGAVGCGIPKQQPVMGRLFQHYCRCLQHSESQQRLLGEIYAAFDGARVDYMPLKGCNLKALYPSPELRTMGDADILIRVEQYGIIRPILLKLEFSEVTESDHELIWRRGDLMLELHKRLIPSYNRDYHRYFGEGWKLAKMERGTRYGMGREDELIYLFTHFAKHYRDGGIGLRHLADLWVYQRAHPQLDMGYVRQELERLGLATFFENVEKTVKAWFGEENWDEMACFIVEHVCASGAYGTQEGHNLSQVVREAGEGRSAATVRYARVWKLIFLPCGEMAKKHPVLKRIPVLLPVFWLMRIFDVLLFRREKLKATSRDFFAASTQAVDRYQQELDFVGLNFNFEE